MLLQGATDPTAALVVSEALLRAPLQAGEPLLISAMAPVELSVAVWLCPPNIYDTVLDVGTEKATETEVCEPHPP